MAAVTICSDFAAQKNIYFSVIDYAKRLVLDLDLVLDCVDHSKLENS